MMLFRIHDDPAVKSAAIATTLDEARHYNERGWGVFHTLQRYRELRRLIANIAAILTWYVEIDSCSKSEQEARLSRSPLIPSLIVESKRSYHVYWFAELASLDTWDAIVRDRLVPFFDGDRAATDPTRLLRVPGFNHLKDPADPFMVREVHQHPVKYTELQMLYSFPDKGSAKRIEKEAKAQARNAARSMGDLSSADFWERAHALDCRAALLRLSGGPAVGCESITLKENTRGTANIFVDGKGTSCWVDRDGKIGSSAGGGPGIAQWVNWYHRDYRVTRRYLLDEFPELKG